MTESPSVRPRARAFWADARFLLGIALIVASVAGVWAVVVASRHTAPVYTAARTIVVGEPITDDDLRVVDVGLGHLADAYLAPATLEPGAVAIRSIGEGELVARAALGPASATRTTTVVLRSDGDVPTAVTAGASVEVWSAPLLDRGKFDVPRVLVSSATVLSVSREGSVMGSAGTTLELVIDRADVADTLAALAEGASLSVVPVTGAAP